MYAYSEIYLDDAMQHMGEMLDYVVYDLHYDLNEFWYIFCSSRIGKLFSQGNPKYNAGMSGVELAREVIFEKTGEEIDIEPSRGIDASEEFWTGWVLAYYQHHKNIDFERLLEYGLDAERVRSMYILHEADISKFCDTADIFIEKNIISEGARLKRLRLYAGLTQKELSDITGVTLRMIQLYEQGRNELSKAQANVVISLANGLGCSPKDLLNC